MQCIKNEKAEHNMMNIITKVYRQCVSVIIFKQTKIYFYSLKRVYLLKVFFLHQINIRVEIYCPSNVEGDDIGKHKGTRPSEVTTFEHMRQSWISSFNAC